MTFILIALGIALAAPVEAQVPQASPTAAPLETRGGAGAPDSKALRANLDSARAEIEQIDAALHRPNLTSDELQDMRARLDPVAERLREQIADLGPKLDAAKARLDQLGPKPKDGAPAEGQDVARDRQEREASVGDLDEINRLARALLLQAEQITAQISDRRRTAFTSALFQRSYSIVSPDLWLSVARSFPRDLRALQYLGEDAWRRFEVRSTPGVLTLLGLAIGLGIALHIGRSRLAPRLVHRDPTLAGISPTRKLLTAGATLIVETAPAAAGSFVIYQALTLLDVLPQRLVPVAAALLMGIAFLAFLQGLVDALFAPDRPAWRLVELPDPIVGSIQSLGITFGIVVVLGRIVDALNQAIAAGLPLSVATKATFAVAAAAFLAILLLHLNDEKVNPVSQEECLGPYIPTSAAIAGPIRALGWLLVGLIVAGALGGYVAFSAFLLDQIVWTASLAGLLYLGILFCDRFLGGTLGQEGSRVSTVLQTNLGLRQRSLRQVGVVASGIGRVVLVIAAIMLALAPWGVESGDIAANLRAAFFGFTVGNVTISLATIAGGMGAFLLILFVTRLFQGWLSDTFLPTTQLDFGLRNSIATAAGYLGFFAACAAAFAYLGLSLEKIAIVAGALSVGIGFGLQSIVNNFVSGLILLWERPIRVGDLVIVGDGEGYVRRISVRATEIETFDRSTVIVPNSSLISGTVKNRTRADQTGRVVLPINVLRNQDPARAADLLIAQATAHPDVLKDPPPRVTFKKIGDTWLEFDLVCFVNDVTKQMRVSSDLNFTIFKMLVGEGILPPMGPGAMNVGGLEPVQAALQSIADAIGQEGLRPARTRAELPGEAAADEEPTRLVRRRATSRS